MVSSRRITGTETPDAAEAFRRAVAFQQQGMLAEAERLCQGILRAQRNHFDAKHLLGVLCHQQGRSDEALKLLSAAIKLKPDAASALCSYGMVLQDLDRHDEALRLYDRALTLRPDHVETLNNRATALIELKRFEDALASYDRALAIRPDFVEALSNRGFVLQRLGRPQEALASYDAALAIKPHLANALYLRGTALSELGQHRDAIASYDRAMALAPNHVEGLYSRGLALDALRQFEEAVASYDRALALRPDHVAALNNRGIALDELQRHEEAVASYVEALALQPDYVEALNNRGTALIELQRFDDALASYDAALAIAPDYRECRWNRALLLLRLGSFALGWQEFEWRRQRSNWVARDLPGPEWDGQAPAGKRLFVYTEHGLGDTLQFARHASLVAAAGAHVTLEAQRSLRQLLGSLAGVTVIAKGETAPAFDCHLPLMSFPRVLGTTTTTVPAAGAYLTADPARTAAWAQRLPRGSFNIGISWQGNPDAEVFYQGRSVPLRRFAPLAAIPGVTLVSLQKNEGTDQLADLPPGMTVMTLGDDFDAGPNAFLDTAAVMTNLDLVISIDTATAHLAGALGRPVWLLLKRVPDWRWMTDGETTPWYPSARLFRQSRPADWDGVIARVASELSRLINDRSSVASR
jgi:tetratricopeptide (TPR) repeat protein